MKDKIFKDIEKLVKPKFQSQYQRFVNVAISPYHPVVVVETFKRRSTKKMNIKSNEPFKWVSVFDHYQVSHFKGLEKLYNEYIKSR